MATVTGATSGVTFISQSSSNNSAMAQALVNAITAINGGSQVSGNALTLTNPVVSTTPVVVGIGGSTPTNTNAGTIVGSLGPNVVAVLINNTSPTTLTNSVFNGNNTVVAGSGGLTFTDLGAGNTFNVGGGSNSFTLSGVGALVGGDGSNTVVLNAVSRGLADTVVGTTASSDTISGALGASVPLVYVDGGAGSTALINPTAGNVTIVGGAGSETVFGSSAALGGGIVTAKAFTGSLTVINGKGYFAGGSAGDNVLGSSTLGGSTLIGGGGGDVLTSNGPADELIAGSGSETLTASNSSGGESLLGNVNGATLMYGSQSQGDNFWLANSTTGGVGFFGAFVALHTGPGQPLFNLNTTVSNNINLGGLSSALGATDASVYDFISGLDKVNVFNANGATARLTVFTKSDFVALQTTSGSNILFLNTTAVKSSDIAGITITNTTTANL
jgi:hypothetical protein